MLDMKSKELVAYASAFVSFILPKIDVKEIILFGSVARGEAEKESDIDLFFDIENKEKEEKTAKLIKNELEKFHKSNAAETFSLRGIKNKISIKVGELDKWSLKRSIISDGIMLYGQYKEIPKDMKSLILFNIQPIKNITKRNKIIRELFGRKEKKYKKIGLLEKFDGKKLSPSSFIVSKEYSRDFINFLGKEKINFSLIEIFGNLNS